ncbi:hypothetical protein AB0I91_40955 [Actinosynnema sp. NPDC049800]
MAVQGDGSPPDRGTFDKATVDRWQVFGGMAGVAALLLSVVGGIQDQVPLSLVAAGVVTLVGVWLLYRWGRRPRQQLTKHFVVPVLLTVVGAATGGVLGGLDCAPPPVKPAPDRPPPRRPRSPPMWAAPRPRRRRGRRPAGARPPGARPPSSRRRPPPGRSAPVR